jgi:hypothetical protein
LSVLSIAPGDLVVPPLAGVVTSDVPNRRLPESTT